MIRFDGAMWYDDDDLSAEFGREFYEEVRWSSYDAFLRERAEGAARDMANRTSEERANDVWENLREADKRRTEDAMEWLAACFDTEERERIATLERCF